MKKAIYSCILLMFLLWYNVSYAANSVHTIQWKGVETWRLDSTSRQVIAFENAIYPSENLLPFVEVILPTTQHVSVTNPQFAAVTNEEHALLLNAEIPQTLKVDYLTITERGMDKLDILIFPFVNENGIYKKLVSYQLTETQATTVKKAPATPLHSYASTSVLASGKFVKIKVGKSGIYRLTYEDLQTMGISPANVRIFGYGGAMLNQDFSKPKQDDLPEVAIYMHKGSDGVFGAGDYILFYAQGPVSWQYSNGHFTHSTNVYSDFGYYFVTSDAGSGKKIECSDNLTHSANDIVITKFLDHQLHEQDLINLIDIGSSSGGGREFYGESFQSKLSHNFSFDFPNAILNQNLSCKICVAASSSVASTFSVLYNNSQKTSFTVREKPSDHYTQAVEEIKRLTFTTDADKQAITISFSSPSTVGKAYLNYLEVSAYRQLNMVGNTMFFRNPDYVKNTQNSLYKVANANTNIKIWNITDPSNAYEVNGILNNDTLQFVASNEVLQEFVAINLATANTFAKPEIVGNIDNQNLHELQDIDFVIITHPDFLTPARKLAAAHELIDQMTTAVVTCEQVYNEFSSGTPDATAYRWLMKMLYDRANQNSSLRMPGYLLLFGDGTFDNRKHLSLSGENKILTYQAVNSVVETLAYCTDDYFGFLDDNEGNSDVNARMDIGIGRLPANTIEQATNMVEKTIRYMKNENLGKWKNQLCFLADDGDNALHVKDTDYAAASVAQNNPTFQVNKIYLDAYLQEVTASGESYPLAKNILDNLLRSGVLFLNYCGHGSATSITNEGMLHIKEIQSLSNTNLALWMFATCSFNLFDAYSPSAGEEALLNPAGGAIGVLSACRTVYASQNRILNKYFCDYIFSLKDNEYLRVGDAIREAKNKVGSELNKLAYIYLGDPAIRLNYPGHYNVKTVSINNKSVEQPDTLRALSTTVIQGIIENKNTQTKATDFNGKLQVIVQDKEQIIKTLDNHKELGNNPFQYNDRPNTLFSGEVNVENGEFTLSFMLPKDIRYNYGNGRIIYYAYNPTSLEDGNGYFEQFVIGGSNDSIITDETGPDVNIYLNSRTFVSGGKVNERPVFMADIQDENGINTVGSGIGHDLVLIVDNDPEKTYVLNEYFTAAPNNFTQGSIRYKMPEMTEGPHTLTFRAWDLINNSTTKELDFEVVANLDPNIYAINTLPNPAHTTDLVQIFVSHDRPETVLETLVTIFDLRGRKVWEISQNGAENIVWNIQDTNVKAGIYLYQVKLRTKDSNYTSKTNKIIVIN